MNPAVTLGITVLTWGFWSFALKQSVRTMHPLNVQVIGSLVGIIFLPLHLSVLRVTGTPFQVSWVGLGWILAASVFSTVGSTANLFSMRQLSASTATAIASSYPAITLTIAVVAGSETFTATRGLGLISVLFGVFLLSR